MKKAVFSLVFGIAVSLSLIAAPSLAQRRDQMQSFGQYDVYYGVMNSTSLEPEVARRYDIRRDEDLAVLTVSVRGPNQEGVMTDQPSRVSGAASDLVTRYPLKFKEFRDPQAVYYIAEVPAEGRTRLDFSLSIQPEGSRETYELKFSQPFYSDGH